MIVVFWKWNKKGYRSKFQSEHVNIAKAMVKRNCTLDLEFVCVTDDRVGLDKDIRYVPLWDNPAPQYGAEGRPNCLYRLKAFSEEAAQIIGPRFVWFDLDMVVTDNIDNIIGAKDDFAMWGDTMHFHQYNGSLCLMDAGKFPKVWDDFKGIDSLHQAQRQGFFGSDQAWISYKMGMDHRMFNTEDGVYSFNNHYRTPEIRAMIPGNKLTFLHGARDPWDWQVQRDYPWIKEHYRA